MNRSTLITVFFLIFPRLNSFSYTSNDVTLISTAILDIIDIYLIKEEIFDFEFFVYCKNRTKVFEMNQILNAFKSEDFAIKVKFVRKIENRKNRIKKSTIAFFCTSNDLNEFNKVSYVDPEFFRTVKIFVISPELDKLNLEHHKSDTMIYQKTLMHEFFINNTQNSIELKSFEMFQYGMCGKPQTILLNRFYKNTKKWEKKLKVYEKFRNFNGCTRVLCLRYGYEFRVSKRLHFSKVKEMKKLIEKNEVSIFKEKIYKPIAKMANFSLLYGFKTVITDKSLKETVKTISAYGVNLDCVEIVTMYGYDAPLWHSYSFTSASFEISPLVFIVPHGEPFSGYEKLFLPFDATTWTLFGFTFGIAFAVIFIVNQMKKLIRNVFYGFRVNAPSLNVLRNFFGIGQVRLPENNFARIILTFFVFFCLIFRTGYQGENNFIGVL